MWFYTHFNLALASSVTLILNLSDLVHELIHRNSNSHRLEGTLGDHPVQPPAQSRHQYSSQTRLLRALYKLKVTHHHSLVSV